MYPYFNNNEIMGCFSITKDVTKIDDMVMNICELQKELRNRKKNNIPINGTRYSLNDIIGESQITKKYIENAYKVSKHKSNILIYGETGTGKELIAQGIHNAGNDYNEPFIGINCSAIPSNLLESLLFGTIKGSFTGALETKGLFEQAGEGTLFLDEVNSMPIEMQPKLLRVLQEKKYRQIGGTKDKNVRCRVISSTNIEPNKAIKLGQLRQDLYYRLAAVTITIPPLRERISDINILIYYFMDKYNKVFNTKFESIDIKLIDACNNYSWPGNVRELEHMVESAFILSENDKKILSLDLFPIFINNEITHSQKSVSIIDCFKNIKKIDLNKELNNYEMELIKNSLINNKGNIAATARQLSIHRSVLYNKMKRLDIDIDKLTECVLT
jgi:arginine utilization regulatory protein